MRRILLAVLYTALAAGANAAPPDRAALAPLLSGDMAKLVLADPPGAPVEAALLDASEAPQPLSGYRGRYVLVNFWATWCAPCRREMPALDRLEAALGGPRFAVVPVATGRNPLPAIRAFFAEAGITRLPVLRDPRQMLAREMAVLGLPVSVILDPEGREIARLTGDAAWDGPEAQALIAALIGATEGAADTTPDAAPDSAGASAAP